MFHFDVARLIRQSYKIFLHNLSFGFNCSHFYFNFFLDGKTRRSIPFDAVSCQGYKY